MSRVHVSMKSEITTDDIEENEIEKTLACVSCYIVINGSQKGGHNVEHDEANKEEAMVLPSCQNFQGWIDKRGKQQEKQVANDEPNTAALSKNTYGSFEKFRRYKTFVQESSKGCVSNCEVNELKEAIPLKFDTEITRDEYKDRHSDITHRIDGEAETVVDSVHIADWHTPIAMHQDNE